MSSPTSTNDQPAFKARLDPTSKSALKVLLMGNELIDDDRKESLAILDAASSILGKRNPKVTDPTAEEGKGTAKESDEPSQTETSAQDTKPEFDSAQLATNILELLGKASDADVQRVMRRIKRSLGVVEEEPELIEFEEIDFGDPEWLEEHKKQREHIAEFDTKHEAHTDICKGESWEKITDADLHEDFHQGKTRCERCMDGLEGRDIWGCEVAACNHKICGSCRWCLEQRNPRLKRR